MNRLLIAILIVGTGAACGSPRTQGTTPVQEPTGPVRLVSATPAEGTTAIDSTCDSSLSEQCNAVDDDCDQRIDEGCPGDQGELTIALAWNSSADLDLVAEAPGDPPQAQRGACASGTPAREMLSWAHAPMGSVRVAVRRVDACDATENTTAIVSARVGDRVAGIFAHAITSDDAVPFVVLELSR